jgi:hypothetical protein
MVLTCAFGLIATSAVLTRGQNASEPRQGLPEDWSHHHVVFVDPGSFTDAVKSGTAELWNRVTSDPRYQIQQWKRNALQRELQAAPDFAARMELLNRFAAPGEGRAGRFRRPEATATTRDWSMELGSAGGSAATITGSVSSAATGGQSIVIANPNTSTSLTLTATPANASITGVFSGEPSFFSSLTITGLGNTLTIDAGFTNSTSCTFFSHSSTVTFARSSTTNTNAANLASLINVSGCGSAVGVTASAPGASQIVITASAAGTAGNNITVQTTSSPNFQIAAWTSATNLSGGLAATQGGLDFETSSTASTEAANIVSAINVSGNGSSVGVSATQGTGSDTDEVTVTATAAGTAGDNITITNGLTGFAIGSPLAGGANGTLTTMGAGQLPAKYSFSTSSTPSCSDYVVYGTGATGSSGQATVIAYNDLYKTTCGSTVPGIKWAYNTGGAAALSPVLSFDGTQVAYIQTASSVASLVVLKMANSGGSALSPAAITSVGNSSYPTCTAPCYTSISLSANDTNSAPFYDYANDVIYVGDDSGNLHQYAHVFGGTSANYLTSVWSTNASSGDTNKYGSSSGLSSPVLDPVTGLVFVGDRYGYLHSVKSNGTGLLTSGQLGNVAAGGPGISDGPLVDVEGSASHVYVFVQDTNVSVYTYINGFATGTSISGTYGTALGFSGVNGTQLLYDGAFDNQWYSSGGTSGNLYVCGVDSTHNAYPTLFQIALPLAAGTNPSSVHTYATLTNAAAGCSPPTEFYNGSTDYLFLSVTGSGSQSACTGACMYSFILPANTTTHTGTASSGLNVAGGSSGIVIDNSGSATGESQIYFSTLSSQSCSGNGSTGSGTGGCAVQASQSGLN